MSQMEAKSLITFAYVISITYSNSRSSVAREIGPFHFEEAQISFRDSNAEDLKEDLSQGTYN